MANRVSEVAAFVLKNGAKLRRKIEGILGVLRAEAPT